ncbi:MAG TPA: hypothetical protein VKR06_06010 [Ktedonosporobacter sp.]|nr:hypothetical protein [Ktedonosporobacter sp.]
MRVRTSSQHMEGAQHSELQNAALIASFYGKRGQLHILIDRMVRELDLSAHGQGSYVKEANKTLLYHFDPPSAHDTTIVQLALNRPGAVEPAWRTMRAQLAAILPDDAALEGVWGYTLIYQAELAQDVFTASVLKQVLPAARGLPTSAPEYPQLLAKTDVPGGWIGLSALPLEGDGLKAATVYVALSQPDPHNRLVHDMLYNPDAALLMADLIAHKGYHQVRQYRLGSVIDRYRQQMDALRTHASDILLNLPEGTSDPGELDALGKQYSALVVAVANLHSLQVGLARQVDNYMWWYKQAGEGEVVGYHQHFLEVALRELLLLVDEGQRPLEAAKMAVDMIGTRLEKEQERKQQRIETLLAATAAVLSVLALVDKEAVRELLAFLGAPQPISIFLILGVQFGLIFLVALLTVLVIRLIRTRHLK